MKLYYFDTLKALRDGRVKLRCIMGCSVLKRQLSGKRSIVSLVLLNMFHPLSLMNFDDDNHHININEINALKTEENHVGILHFNIASSNKYIDGLSNL